MICKKCGNPMFRNIYWRARNLGCDYLCYICHLHYDSKENVFYTEQEVFDGKRKTRIKRTIWNLFGSSRRTE